MNISDKQADYVHQAVKSLKEKGFRVIEDLRNEKISFKIREHTIQRVPYLLIAGEREQSLGQFALRDQAGNNKGCMTLGEFVKEYGKDAIRQAGRPGKLT